VGGKKFKVKLNIFVVPVGSVPFSVLLLSVAAPDFYPTWMPAVTSAKEEGGGGEICCLTAFFLATEFTKF
jgi:hypothetical protein